MSNDMDLRTSYKKFIQDLPQLLADKGPEQVYALYKAENYGSLRAGGFREEIERMASPAPHWCDQGFFRLAELYDGLRRLFSGAYEPERFASAESTAPRPAIS